MTQDGFQSPSTTKNGEHTSLNIRILDTYSNTIGINFPFSFGENLKRIQLNYGCQQQTKNSFRYEPKAQPVNTRLISAIQKNSGKPAAQMLSTILKTTQTINLITLWRNKMAKTFVNAVKNQEARTENGMKARASTSDALVDLFFKMGAMRGQDVIPAFAAAFAQDRTLALRIALWARDVRGGAGERKIFRDVLTWLEKTDKDAAIALLQKTPLVGRWDDLQAVSDGDLKLVAFNMMKDALEAKNGLAAKWIPRKGDFAREFREFLGWSPKRYRKTLVDLTKVVEQQMCAQQWDEINFSHVPSVAAKRYRKAFYKHTPKYAEYVEALKTGKMKTIVNGEEVEVAVKINASAIFPHDVLRGKIMPGYTTKPSTKTELDATIAQWNALPDYIGTGNILPLVDVSGSMTSSLDKSGLRAIDVAVSLGLYCADKNKGKFNGTFLTFSFDPELLYLKGDIFQKISQMSTSKWSMSTDLHAAFKKILDTAVKGGVPVEEMPETLLILSDMQFNSCARYDDSAIEMIRRKYEEAGYTMPKVVFWNLQARDNAPVKFDEHGVALVSGFSPSILKSIMANDMEEFTPRALMLKTILQDRYAV